jgi:exonuclease III
MLNVISGYAPLSGCQEEEKEKFISEMEEMIREIGKAQEIIIGADLNCLVGESN